MRFPNSVRDRGCIPELALALSLAIVAGCGDGWEKVPAGTEQSLKAVWGSGPRDVWAVGRLGTIVHFDGDGWSESPSGVSYNLHGVWGSGPSDVWAVGDAGTALHWNGSAWSKTTMSPANDLTSIWGSGPSDVWAVQANNAKTLYSVLHWDGSQWAQVPLGLDALPELIAGSGPKDIWMTQNLLDGQKLLHYTGGGWQQVPIEISGVFQWNSLLVTGPGEVWLIGRDVPNASGFILHFDGKTWKPSTSRAVELSSPEGAFATGPQDLWVAASWGTVLHYDGSTWSNAHGKGIESLSTDLLNGIWGDGEGTLWAVGDHGVALRGHR